MTFAAFITLMEVATSRPLLSCRHLRLDMHWIHFQRDASIWLLVTHLHAGERIKQQQITLHWVHTHSALWLCSTQIKHQLMASTCHVM
jgi:hypothetical protein